MALIWDETMRTRLEALREQDASGRLNEAERMELTSLMEARCRFEDAAIRNATRRADDENTRLAEKVEEVGRQNRALQELIREQETYLAEVEVIVAEMDKRRKQWRDRYMRVTGRAMEDPIGLSRPGR